MTYEFSCPIPFQKHFIDKLISINNQVERSKITSLYFSLPTNSPDFTGFEQGRFCLEFTTNFEYWKPLIEYSIFKGFNFIYLLNSPKVYNPEFDNVNEKLEKLDRLINNLRKLGCNKVRVCNPQLIGYINKNYPDFELYLSTSAELQSIKQYANLFSMFKNIKEFVPSWDLNKNFMFLKNIQKRFPDIKIELMVNEGCLAGCPIKTAHNLFHFYSKKIKNSSNYFSYDFYINKCYKNFSNNVYFYLCNSNIIYPWEISEYKKVGINKFKLVGRNNIEFVNGDYFIYYKYYLSGIDNVKSIDNIPIRYFNNYIFFDSSINFLVKDLKKYLPQIHHFKQKGQLCSTICGVKCNYCYMCAEKIKHLNKKDK